MCVIYTTAGTLSRGGILVNESLYTNAIVIIGIVLVVLE